MVIYRKNWSKEDVEFLIEHYIKKGSPYCSKELDRTQQSVIKKARSLGLKPGPVYKSRNYEIEVLREVVQKSKSFSDVCRNLELQPSCGNRNTVKRYIEKYNVDISHFDYGQSTLKDRKNPKRKLEEILVVNSTHTSTFSLKTRLYKEGLKTCFCELCGQDENWRGKKMTLILDHINGIHSDNRIENLRIVCPNCNATLDTHCVKKHKNEKVITKNTCGCGREKLVNSNSCIVCNSANMERKVKNRPDYETLKSELEFSNYTVVGRKYGVSDNAVRNWIKQYEKHLSS